MYWYYPMKHGSGHTPSAAIRQGDFKLILDLETESIKLFNVKNDISEEHDLSREEQILANNLKAKLIKFLDQNKHKY
jgi:arylsulfatase A-like enzyme